MIGGISKLSFFDISEFSSSILSSSFFNSSLFKFRAQLINSCVSPPDRARELVLFETLVEFLPLGGVLELDDDLFKSFRADLLLSDEIEVFKVELPTEDIVRPKKKI